MVVSLTRSWRSILRLFCLFLWLTVSGKVAFSDKSDQCKCKSLLNTGKWATAPARHYNSKQFTQWLPEGCMLHTYGSKDIETCIRCKRMVFVGDSTIRQIFWETAKKLDKEKAEVYMVNASYHESQNFNAGCHDLSFIWDPYLNSSTLDVEMLAYSENRAVLQPTGPDLKKTAIMFLGGGLWHARYLGENFQSQFQKRVDEIVAYKRDSPQRSSKVPAEPPHQRENGPDLLLFAPVATPLYSKLSPARAETLLPDRINSMNEYLRRVSDKQGLEVLWSLRSMTWQQKSSYEENGIHVVENVAAQQADVMLNLRCNSAPDLQHYPFNKSCCHAGAPINVQQTIMTVALAIAVLLTLSGTGLQFTSSNSEGLYSNSLRRMVQVAAACSTIGIAVHECFVSDRTPFLDKVPKIADQGVFLVLTGTALNAGLLCFRKPATRSLLSLEKPGSFLSDSQTFLSRTQTEEWKGWMQVVILMYHYTGMSKTMWIYEVVRVLVASYLFLTTYGHTTYFLKTNDFSLYRCASVLLRLNVLSCLLTYMMRTDYDFYYFPGLCSLWFLIVYVTIRIRHNTGIAVLGVKIFVSALTLTAIMHVPGVLESIFQLPRLFCNFRIDIREFRFRVSLDLYVPYVGMATGAIYHHVKTVPAMFSPRLVRYARTYARQLRILAVLASLITLPCYFILIRCFTNKYDYNRWHPVISFLPILSFITLRNSTQRFRTHHSNLFAWLGRCSLETYILQYHMWLAADTKGLLSLGLWHHRPSQGWIERWTEFAVLTVNFIWTSYEVSQATGVVIRGIVGERRDFVPRPIRDNRSDLDLDKQRLSPLPKGYQRTPLSFSDLNDLNTAEQPSSLVHLPLARRLALILLVMGVMNWTYY